MGRGEKDTEIGKGENTHRCHMGRQSIANSINVREKHGGLQINQGEGAPHPSTQGRS